ncbi:MAG: hypothetical protein V2I43_16180 [Parvularcula sp.]|jgi:hypothetical protein|nr:hypothetical protein [Parvularcula sp.]
MISANAIKEGMRAFFVTVGILGSLHYLVGWPGSRDGVFVPAAGLGILAVIKHCLGKRVNETEK